MGLPSATGCYKTRLIIIFIDFFKAYQIEIAKFIKILFCLVVQVTYDSVKNFKWDVFDKEYRDHLPTLNAAVTAGSTSRAEERNMNTSQ